MLRTVVIDDEQDAVDFLCGAIRSTVRKLM